jgi:dinuclear metal center YbgI/SA1388 family protein
MKTLDIINFLETVAPSSLQETYDNAGLIYGSPDAECSGVLVCLDVTEAVIEEAIHTNCNLVIAHHPLVFKGLKKINPDRGISRVLVRAIKNDISIYAIHTNIDNVIDGVNDKIADTIGLVNRKVLEKKQGLLKKLVCFVPLAHLEPLQQALFDAGAGNIGKYSDCSFATGGTGTFKAGEGTDPFVGTVGSRHTEEEMRLEVVFSAWQHAAVISAMKKSHPYEEIAYDVLSIDNPHDGVGSGLIGELQEPLDAHAFFGRVKERFHTPLIRHSPLTGKAFKKIAICGGAGSFLISNAIAAGADLFLTADLKYHDFFEADGRIVLADMGHFESEQFTQELLFDLLKQKFPNFAVLKTGVATNPVNYFL